MKIKVNILNVNCGDSIIFNYCGDDNQLHNILIDGGFPMTYEKVLKPQFLEILKNNYKIDLLIVSHYDNDHIGGILKFINDTKIEKSFVNRWWVNDFIPYEDSTKISINQLGRLTDFLRTKRYNTVSNITNEIEAEYLYGAKITVLSPSINAYNEAIQTHSKQTIETNISSNLSDYNILIDNFEIKTSKEDTSISNRSSIGVLIERFDFTFLFMADCVPSIIVESLKRRGYSSQNKVKIDYCKISHHGCKNNISLDLLDILECSNFIISSNGLNRYNLPHKETYALILRRSNRDFNKKINFYFRSCLS
jgi:beta-lactamase superfamily II metal-dependent hydrolase